MLCSDIGYHVGMAGERMWTVREVAERVRVDPVTVRRWIKAGRLKAVRPGGTKAGWRIPAEELGRLLRGEAPLVGPPPSPPPEPPPKSF